MAGSSVTGTGKGYSNKPTTTELAALAVSGPQIYAAGSRSVEDGPASSPPGYNNAVTLPYPLPGPSSNYVIILTSINAGNVYVSYINEDDDENLTGFAIIAEAEGDVHYLVVKKGHRSV